MKFRHIGLIARSRIEGIMDTLLLLTTFCEQQKISFALETETAALLPFVKFNVIDSQEIGHRCDLIIVVGGDGSLLSAARTLSYADVPIVGINRGKLGFLADITPREIETKLKAILNGDYHEEKRFMLEAFIEREEGVELHGPALNEIALTLDQAAQMFSFEVYVNNVFMYSQRSDGLIIATPTGSTAYALSAGGPILHPDLDAIALIPMFPHTLMHRPIVLGANSHIRICVLEKAARFSQIICDGQMKMTFSSQEIIHIRKSSAQLRLIHPQQYDYFETLRSKLHWGRQLTDKAETLC